MPGAGRHRAARAQFRHIFAAIDLHRQAALAWAPERAAGAEAARFPAFRAAAMPVPIRRVLTDNGGEFQGDCAQGLARRGIARRHACPNCPRMNTHAERFNRALQEDFVADDEELMRTDRPRLDRRLPGHLGRRSGERPRRGLGLRAPIAALSDARAPESGILSRSAGP